MKQAIFVCCVLAVILPISHQFYNIGNPSVISTWIERDWPNGNGAPEDLSRDNSSGCYYRIRYQEYAVFYGNLRCLRFPKEFPLPKDIYDVRLKTSNIRNLTHSDFEYLSHLESLLIDANAHFAKIYPGTFSGMTKLRNLSISYNPELKVLHELTFQGLVNLEILRLVKNGFKQILDATQAVRTDHLPNLLSLTLSENEFSDVNETSFMTLYNTNVTELDLTLCQIETIHPKSLNVFQNLTKLRIGDNLISEDNVKALLNELADSYIPIKSLDLYNLGYRNSKTLKSLFRTVVNLNVTHLYLSRNHLELVPNDLFPYMENLQYLDMREMSVMNVDDDAFSRATLPNLQSLLLGGNKIMRLVPGILIEGLSELDLSSNADYHSNSYFDVSTNNLSDPLTLKYLDLSYNRISALMKNSLVNLESLEVLLLKNATIFFIHNRCFANLTKLRVLNLENNPLKPFNLFRFPIFEGLVNLEALYLSNCKIVTFLEANIFKSLINLKYLYLRDNEILKMDAKIMYPLVSLIRMDLSENRIQPWNVRQFQNNTNLRTLLLSGNRLNTVTVAMLEDFTNLTVLDITHNAYFCDCKEFSESVQWLIAHNLNANETLISSPDLVCSGPEQWRNTRLDEFIDSKGGCKSLNIRSVSKHVYIFITVMALISLGVGILAYIYRWHIRYWVFLTKMAFIRRHGWALRKNKVQPGDYTYDVFVSYSHEDRAFVVRLVTMLEDHEPFLKLCVYERDFEIGTLISNTVMEKVAASRRTLLVVSNSFAKSQWCMWELQLAEYHRLFFRPNNFQNDPLLIIKLGPISENNMTPTLKFLLKSRIYLEWSSEPKKQVAFWERLRSTLKPHLKTEKESKTRSESELEKLAGSEEINIIDRTELVAL